MVDVSNPQQPTLANSIQLDQGSTGAAVRATPGGSIYAYIGESGACQTTLSRGFRCDGLLRVLDISDPTTPAQRGSLKTQAPPIEFVVKEDKLYLIEQHCDMDAGCHGGLELVDLSDEAKPSSSGFVEAQIWSLVVANNLVVADKLQIWEAVNLLSQSLATGDFKGQVAAVVDDKAFLFDQAELQIVDISDPAVPHEIGRYRSFGPISPDSMRLSAPYLYVTDYARGLLVIDLTDPTMPRKVGNIDDDTYNQLHQIQWIGGDKIYLNDDTSTAIQIINTGDPTQPREAGQYTSLHQTVKASGNYAYAGTPTGLQIIDLTNPAAPVDVGFYHLPSISSGGLWPLDGYVYLTLQEQGLQIVDLSTLDQPTPLGSYNLPLVFDLTIVEGYGYYTISREGLQIVDLTHPTQPIEVSLLPLPSVSRLVAVANDMAYLRDEQGYLRLVDVSDPAAPVERGVYQDSIYEVVVEQDRPIAYLLQPGPKLISLDLSDPATPVELSEVALPFNMSDANGSIIGRQLYVYNKYGYLDGHPLVAFDVSNPAAPIELGGSTPPGAPRKIAPSTCAAQPDGAVYGYLQNLDNELVIVDLSDPTQPVELGRYRPASGAHFVKVLVDNCLVYLLDAEDAVWVIDVSDPTNPQETAHHTHFPSGIDLITVNDYAYLSAPQKILRVVDVSNPAQPQEVWAGALGGGWVGQFEPAGKRAYLLQNQPGGFWLKTLDISDRANPTVLGTAALPQKSPHQLQAASEQYIYLIDPDGNLIMLDMSYPEHPVEVGRYDAPAYLRGIALGGDYVVIASDAGLQVLQVLPN